MKLYRTNGLYALAVLAAACSVEGCGEEVSPRPVSPAGSSSSSSGAGGEGASGGNGGGGAGGAQGGNGGNGGIGGLGGQGGASSSSSGGQGGQGGQSGVGGMGGQGSSVSSSSGSSSGAGGQGGMLMAICGDGAIDGNENCDDMNMQGADGCSAACQIESGYMCSGMPSVCVDINECMMNNGGCSSNASCMNTPGSRNCMCNSGYTGDGVNCADINECMMNNGGCSVNATCTNTPGSRTCMCNSGYSGDGINCMPVNACAMNNGGCSMNATCSFVNAMVMCTCNTGYSGNGITCSDINECMMNNGGCSMNATCMNTPGSRTCTCNGGYMGDGVTCADINECLMNNGGCSMNATCTNTPGSRNCTCNSGYMGDGITCTDINECMMNNGGCSGNATCMNTPGSRNCTCKSGYMGDGVTCTDINECMVNNGGCGASQSCVNTPGSFMCIAGCSTDPVGLGNAVFTIGPSEAVVALCNGQTLVGNQVTNQLEVRTSTGAIGSSHQLPDKPYDIVYDAANNLAYATLFNTMAATTDLIRVNMTNGSVTSIPIGGLGLHVVLGNNGLVFVSMSDATSFPNRPIALVDGPNGTLIKTFAIPYGGALMAYDRNANLFYLADEGASPSKLERYGFDPMTQTLTLAQSRMNAGNNGVDLAISPDGLHVAFSCTQGNATNPIDYKLHDINSADLNATFGTWTTGQYPTAAVFSPDNLRLFATNGSTMRRFGVASHALLGGENVLTTCTNGSVRRMAMSPGGTLQYVLTKCGSPPTSGRLSRFYFP